MKIGSDVAHRAFPLYGVIGMFPMTGQSDYHGLQTNFTKRLSHRWQGSLTYTLSGLWDQDPAPISGTAIDRNPLSVASRTAFLTESRIDRPDARQSRLIPAT